MGRREGGKGGDGEERGREEKRGRVKSELTQN